MKSRDFPTLPCIFASMANCSSKVWFQLSRRASFILENLKIQTNIIENAWLMGVKRLLFLGSSCIYPKNSGQPIKEEFLLSDFLEETNSSYALANVNNTNDFSDSDGETARLFTQYENQIWLASTWRYIAEHYADEPIIAGCELIDGSGIFNNKEEFPMRFCEIDGVAGDDGAVVIWPDTGNDLLKYGEGNSSR